MSRISSATMTFAGRGQMLMLVALGLVAVVYAKEYNVHRITQPSQCPQSTKQAPQYGMCELGDMSFSREQCVEMLTLGCPHLEGWVQEGSVCYDLSSLPSLAYNCTSGKWTSTDEMVSDHREKRFWWIVPGVIIGYLACLIICPKPPPNKPPKISCPNDVHVTAEAGKVEAPVSWDLPTATDEEDGTPNIRKRHGLEPGSIFPSGRSPPITYEARDNGGLTATCSFSVFVEVVKCPVARTPMYGNYPVCSGAVLENQYGAQCQFSCRTGYYVKGSSIVTCGRDGSWSDSFPKCLPVSCGDPGTVTGGSVRCDRGLSFPAWCGIVCKPGYRHRGTTYIACTADASWTPNSGCEDKEAPTFPHGCPPDRQAFSGPRGSPVTVTWDDPQTNDNSQEKPTVTSDKASGSSFPLGFHTVKVTATDGAGNSRSCKFFIYVKERRCQMLFVSDGRIHCDYGSLEGSRCNVICNRGYQVQGQASVLCRADGTWSHDLPTCEKVTCPPTPPAVEGGSWRCSGSPQYLSDCFLRCRSGYTVQQPDLVTCNADGEWTQHGSCLDTEPPVLECPDSFEVFAPRVGQETNVTWYPPTVTDNSGENVVATSDIPSGSSLEVGVTHVTYTGEDSNGNIGTCQFSVIVTTLSCGAPNFDDSANTHARMLYQCPSNHVYGAQCALNCTQGYPLLGSSVITCERDDTVYPPLMSWKYNGTRPECSENNCPKLDPPENGALSCLLGNAGWDCLMSCNENWDIPVASDGRFICTNSGGFWQPATVPDCSVVYKPNRVNLPSEMYYFTGQCNVSLQEIRENFIAALSASNWRDACVNVPTCIVESVQVTCGPFRRRRSVEEEPEGAGESAHSHQRRRRQTSGSEALIVSFTISMDYVQNGMSNETYRNYEERGLLLYDVLMNATADGLLDLGSLTPDPRYTLTPVPTFDGCPDGTKYVQRFNNPKPSCVGCSKGHYMDEEEECQVCPVGQYTELDNATSCTPCPEGFSTLTNASGSRDDCMEFCTAGSFSPSGFVPCQPCPAGQFQSSDQSITCDRCPAGTWTQFAGSTGKADCVAADVKMAANASLSASLALHDSSVTLMTWLKMQPNSAMSVVLQSYSALSAFAYTMGIFSEGASDALANLSLANTLQVPEEQWTRLVIVYETGEITSVVSVYQGDQHLVNITLPSVADPSAASFTVDVLRGRGILSALHAELGAWSREQIQAPSYSCNEHVAENVLTWSPKPSAIYMPSLCDAVDECQSSPCGPQGVCENRPEGFLCHCLNGWTGDTCQISPGACYQHQCQNDARCVPSGQNYSCECREENSGRVCQLEKVHGSWGDWEEWTQCSDTCGGQQHRQRHCNNPAPSNEGHNCSGHATETQSCGEPECIVDGEWSLWGDWSSCSATCGGGETTRFRRCDDPAPQNGGADCSGVSNETSVCATAVCPIDGNWGNWLPWSPCSATCGDGTQSRERSCDNPVPANQGEPCQGSSNQTRLCNMMVCPECSDLGQYEVRGTRFICNQTSSPYRNTCSVQCTQGYSTPSPTVYTCGEETGYLWNFERENATEAKHAIQYCSPLKTPTRASLSSAVPLPDASCDQKDQVETQMKDNLKELPCVQESSCNVVIRGQCHSGISTGSRRKRDTSSVVVMVDLTADFGDSVSATDSNSSSMEEFVDIFTKVDQSAAMLVLNDTERLFTVTVDGVTITPDTNVSYTVQLDCAPGTSVASDGGCVDCPAGFYEESGQCVLCPLGQYQDQTGSTSCKPCPNQASWDSPGASDLSQCLNPKEDEIPSEADEINIGVIGASIGGGVAVIIIIIIIVVCVRLRRKELMEEKRAHDAEENSRKTGDFECYTIPATRCTASVARNGRV